MSRDVMKLALEVMRNQGDVSVDEWIVAEKALREALAEQPAQQEPVAWPCLIAEADFSENTVTLAMQCTDYKVSAGKHWLYTSPPAQRTWVGLTKEDSIEIQRNMVYGNQQFSKVIEAIESKLKEKNT